MAPSTWDVHFRRSVRGSRASAAMVESRSIGMEQPSRTLRVVFEVQGASRGAVDDFPTRAVDEKLRADVAHRWFGFGLV